MALSRLFVLLLCIVYVSAHGWLSNPKPRGQYLATPKRDDQEAEPVGLNNNAVGDPFDKGMVCRNDPAVTEDKYITLTAGQKLPISFDVRANHPGDCAMYLTYDGDKADGQKKWFKFWENHNCGVGTNGVRAYTITIPDYLPSASHAILRFEWYALHRFPEFAEYYTQCVDAKVSGIAGGSLPMPQVSIPGHLPRMTATNYWDPYNGAAPFFTGPPIATRDGKPAPSTSASTTAASGSGQCDVGAEKCYCTAGGGCDKGLTCVSDVCVNPVDALKGSASATAAFFLLCAGCVVLNLL